METGSVIMFGATSPPTGYLPCDGSAVSRATYAALFAVVGTTFGTGDGTTTFNVPNFTSRMPIGSGTISFASTGGSFNHTHNVPVLSGSTDIESGDDNSVDNTIGGFLAAPASHTHTLTTATSITDTANPPYLVIAFIIKT